MRSLIFLELNSRQGLFKAFVKFKTLYTNPKEGGLARLALKADGFQVGEVTINWLKIKRRKTPKGQYYLIGPGTVDFVEIRHENQDVTQLIFDAMKEEKWAYYSADDPLFDPGKKVKSFQEWVLKNL